MRSFASKIFVSMVFVLSAGIFSAYGLSEEKLKDLKQLRSEHFIIYYHKDAGERYAYKVKDLCERYYRKVTQEFNLVRDELWLWENRAVIYIAADRDDYVQRFPCPSWSGACVDYTNKKIYTYPDQYRFEPVLAHELTHIILREYIGKNNLPLWLDEAIAVYMEDKYGGKYYEQSLPVIKEHIKNDTYIKFSKLMQMNSIVLNMQSRDNVDLFYLEVFSISNFLVKRYGRDNFAHFLFFLKNGFTVEEAISKGIPAVRNIEDLEDKWKRYYSSY